MWQSQRLLAPTAMHMSINRRRPLHALHFIEGVLGGAPEQARALRLYREAHERLLAESADVDNAYEQNYLQSVISETAEALENLQAGR